MDCNIKEIENKPGIYVIRNVINNKVYVGQSVEIIKRFRAHKNLLLKNKHHNNYLQNAYNKCNDFVFEVLEYCSIDELNEREVFWIQFYNSNDVIHGYNIDPGGSNVLFRNPITLKRMSESQKEYWSLEENRLKFSIRKSTLNVDEVKKVKEILSKELRTSCEEIADRLNISLNIVLHIRDMNSHSLISKHLNYLISNRTYIIKNRDNKSIMRMYRDGCTFSEMSETIGVNLRTVIRRINSIKTEHDDRCRLNCINKSFRKRNSLIFTLYNMGKNTVEINKILGVSRTIVSEVLSGGYIEYENINETRGKFKMKIR